MIVHWPVATSRSLGTGGFLSDKAELIDLRAAWAKARSEWLWRLVRTDPKFKRLPRRVRYAAKLGILPRSKRGAHSVWVRR
jgi:hypothetical protein